jgi:hypothetical protein
LQDFEGIDRDGPSSPPEPAASAMMMTVAATAHQRFFMY